MARQGDFAFVHTSNALSTQGHRRARHPGHPSDGNAKTAADHEAYQGGWGVSALQTPVPEGTPTGGPGVRVVRATGTQKPPPTMKPIRAVWGLSTLQAPVPEGAPMGGPGIRVIRATGTQKPPPTAKSVRAVGRLGSVRASSACPRRNANRRVRRPGHPNDGNAKTAADREACQGGLGVSALQTPAPEGTPTGGPGIRVVRATGTQNRR